MSVMDVALRAAVVEVDALKKEVEAGIRKLKDAEINYSDLAKADTEIKRLTKALKKAGSHGFSACKRKRFDHCVVAINVLVDEALDKCL
jgi:altronate dehydratase